MHQKGWCVHAADGFTTLTNTGRHIPKTASSWRTISVCDEVIEAIK